MEDPTGYEAVAKDIFNYGNVALTLAMASETNMVQCLCEADTPLTSTTIATRLKLKERYVREVINSLTSVGLVHLEPGTGGAVEGGSEAKYWVPPACREVLRSYSAFALMISMSARKFDDLRKCMDLDGPYCVRFSSIDFDGMERMSEVTVDTITNAILKTPGLKELLEKGIKALEVGGGTGWLFLRFAELFPNSHFTLSDPIAQPLEVARQHVEKRGLKNVSIKVLDIFDRPADLADESFDWIATMDMIHDLPYPLKALQEIQKLLKPGGHYSLVDQMVPGAIRDNVGDKDVAALYAMSTFLCVPESYQREDSVALGACWGKETACRLVEEAGMTVSGLTRSPSLGTLGVGMCHKPLQEQKE